MAAVVATVVLPEGALVFCCEPLAVGLELPVLVAAEPEAEAEPDEQTSCLGVSTPLAAHRPVATLMVLSISAWSQTFSRQHEMP